MVSCDNLLLFVAASVLLALTPGPNMLYLISRTLAQGRVAGILSLLGTTSGLVVHVVAAALGLSAILISLPLAYDALRWAGAVYLLWLAWDAVRASADRPGGPGLEAPKLAQPAPSTLFRTGMLTSILNPKVALFYLALFPQFVDVGRGGVLAQSLTLGAVQVLIGAACDGLFVLAAARMAGWLRRRPVWAAAQRWLLASVFAGIAAKLAFGDRR